ncbi:MAG TPA: hypothetical protein VK709_20675, partial [Candidatus Saccharimonadales bacterium]|nr:hypothetical protein [Candidatus Saccharimonadales bacterium]
MTKTLLHARLAALLLTCIAVPLSIGAKTKPSPTKKPLKFIYLLPEGFKGWICVDFGIAGAPPLPREGNALVIRPRQGEVLKTSDTSTSYSLYGEGWIEIRGRRIPLPNGMTVQEGVINNGTTEHIKRG